MTHENRKIVPNHDMQDKLNSDSLTPAHSDPWCSKSDHRQTSLRIIPHKVICPKDHGLFQQLRTL